MKTITLNLSAGVLVLGPMLAATMRQHKDAIGQAQRGQLEPLPMLDLTCTLAAACARRVDASITEDQVAELIDMENFGQVFSACWGVSVPEVPAGEAQQAVNPST